MKFNFFFISYTVIYAKYNHCYEIPKDLPVRYFDGKEWKFMKPRHNVRTKALRHVNMSNMSTELNWADLIKEIELQETTTQISPRCVTKARTTTTEKITTEITTTEKTTTKKLTTKKITTKMTTPKYTLKKVRPVTKPTTSTKAAMKHTTPRCKLKLKTTPTPSIDPRIWQMKMMTSEDWINAWTRVRPTKKLCPVQQELLVDPSHCKLTTQTTTTTTVDPLIWQMKMTPTEDWINIWTRERPTLKPSSVTTKKYTTKSLPTTSTKKPATTTKAPVATTKEAATTMAKPVKLSGIQGNADVGNGPENWSNLMREFLKFVELKKCRPPCEYATMKAPFSEYMHGAKKVRSGDEELTNILMDGIEVDGKLREIDGDAFQGKEIIPFKEIYDADRVQNLNFDSKEGSVSTDSKINNDSVQDLDIKSFKDSIKDKRIKQDEETAKYHQNIALLKELKSKNDYVKQDYETIRVRQPEVYFDELMVKTAREGDEVIKDSEINSYIDALKDKYTKKEKDSETKTYLDAYANVRHTGKAPDEDIRKRLDAIKNVYTQTHKDNSQYEYTTKDPLNFKELNRLADYVPTKRTYFTDSTEMTNDNEEILQDRDITFELGTFESDRGDKYSTESLEIRDSGIYAYADTVNDINEHDDEKTIKSYENVIPLFNFKYALNENITN